MTTKPRYEVHEHSVIRGDRANKEWLNTIVHSHEGGDEPHVHPDTGPACYTIDKDEWYAKTGLRGGAKKKFTAKPKGEQLPLIPKRPKPFQVIVCKPPKENRGEGSGIAPIARMNLAFGSVPVFAGPDDAA